MAHSCPECGSTCYCGMDIDPVLISDTRQEDDCTCCAEGAPDDWGDEDDWGDVIHDGDYRYEETL